MSRDACHALAVHLGIDPDTLLELWTERAAIREFDGGQPRDLAEREALDDTRAMFSASLAIGERRGPRSSDNRAAAAPVSRSRRDS